MKPKLYMKCTAHSTPNDWWTVGKLYPVEDNRITSDPSPSNSSIVNSYDIDRSVLSGRVSADFIPVWLLPNGTELEALE
jgi:hypothetical protein